MLELLNKPSLLLIGVLDSDPWVLIPCIVMLHKLCHTVYLWRAWQASPPRMMEDCTRDKGIFFESYPYSELRPVSLMRHLKWFFTSMYLCILVNVVCAQPQNNFLKYSEPPNIILHIRKSSQKQLCLPSSLQVARGCLSTVIVVFFQDFRKLRATKYDRIGSISVQNPYLPFLHPSDAS